MMSEMVDKWKVISKIIDLENAYVYHKEEWDAQTLSRKIDELESEIGDWDATDLVRCRDCKRFVDDREARSTYCNRGLKMLYMKPEDFCSHGEREK